MIEQKLFVLVSIEENALRRHWWFRATDELAVARYLLRNAWDYDDVFWALRISLREVDQISADELLQAIRDSYPNNRVRAALYLIPFAQPADCDPSESQSPAPGQIKAH